MKVITPHEPNEELLSVDDAFADARESEARWQAFEAEHRLKRVFIDFPEPLYNTLGLFEVLCGRRCLFCTKAYLYVDR